MTAARMWWSLSAAERRIHVAAIGVVVIVRVLLWMLPSRIIMRWVQSREVHRPAIPSSTTRVSMAVIAHAVERAARRVPRATCLTQALAAQVLLGRAGYASRMGLGVARSADGAFRAHAWLEIDGRVIMGARGMSGLTRLPHVAPAHLVTSGQRRP